MTYEYTDKSERSLTMTHSRADREYVLLGLEWSDAEGFIHIANEDAPTVAAELLKAAGRDDLAGYLTGVAETRPTIAERAAIEAEKKLQERRDALAKRFSKDVNGDYIDYKACGPYTKAAIDSYIELEDGK